MSTTGITWHARVLDQEAFDATVTMLADAFGLQPNMAMDGFKQYEFDNGSMLELYVAGGPMVPDYGYNVEGISFGFRVEDVAEASAALEAAGAQLLGEINRVPDFNYAYRHFRGVDGVVYGLNESKPQPA
jgi:predicted enzyme related to lactoylglutathione lyase